MKSYVLTALAVGLGLSVFAQSAYPTIGKIERFDPAVDALLPGDAKIEVLAGGFTWAEGPVWIKSGGNGGNFLLFSDVPQNTVFKWTQKEGVTPFIKPSGYTGVAPYGDEPGSNGLTVDAKGRLISCEHGDRRVSALSLDGGGKRTLADNYQGKRFNSPNDVAVHANGSIYFTDPPYGMPKKEKDPTRETDLFGVYRVDPAGKVSLVVSDLTRPNGIAFSPDGKIMYIAQSDPQRPVIMAYPVAADGSVGKGRVLYDAAEGVKQKLPGLPDGLKVAANGTVWSSGPGGILILSPEGKLLGRINTGEATANCAWGDDGTTLYITADMYLCRVKTTTKGN